MKSLLFSALILAQVQASASSRTNNPQAPLKITCTQPDGQVDTVRVMKVYYSGEGKAAGMNFGPNRGDEGFYVLQGECEITTDVKSTGNE